MKKKIIIGLLLSCALTVQAVEKESAIYVDKNWRVCFTPPYNKCTNFIIDEIAKARETVHIMAYGFTSSEIAKALIDAKSRGVSVHVLLDKSNLVGKTSQMQAIRAAGIDTAIYRVSAIAHNKIIIIDSNKVITGSFNFTNSANTKNAENVIVIEDKALAERYLLNFHSFKE